MTHDRAETENTDRESRFDIPGNVGAVLNKAIAKSGKWPKYGSEHIVLVAISKNDRSITFAVPLEREDPG